MFSGLLATSNAACTAAPDDIPASIPSFCANAIVPLPASSSVTVIISSITSRSVVSATNPGLIPCILCEPFSPPLSTGDDAASTAIALKSGFSFLIALAIPVTVPPVPTADISIYTFPSVSFSISCPVSFSWISGFAWFSNCCKIMELSISLFNLSASLIAPGIPSAAGVSTRSAPKIFTSFLLSMENDSGNTIFSLYPFAAAAKPGQDRPA